MPRIALYIIRLPSTTRQPMAIWTSSGMPSASSATKPGTVLAIGVHPERRRCSRWRKRHCDAPRGV